MLLLVWLSSNDCKNSPFNSKSVDLRSLTSRLWSLFVNRMKYIYEIFQSKSPHSPHFSDWWAYRNRIVVCLSRSSIVAFGLVGYSNRFELPSDESIHTKKYFEYDMLDSRK